MAGKVSDLLGALKGPVSRELMSREGRRLTKANMHKPAGDEEKPAEELSGGQVVQPRSVARAFESEDSPETKKAFDEEFGG